MPLGASTLPDLARAVVSDAPPIAAIDSTQPLSLTTDGSLRVSSILSVNDQVWRAIVAADDPFVQNVNPWADELPSTATVNRPHAGETR